MTCSNSSPVPSRATIEWSSGMTIRIWEPGRSLRVSVNSLSRLAWRPGPSAWRPCHRPAAKHMRVHVPDRLPRFRTRVEHDPVSAVGDTLVGGDLVRLGDELVEQAISGTGQGGDVRNMVARNHQDVRGRLGIDVAEGDDPLAVNHHGGRNLPGHDPAEQAVWHTPIIVARRRYAIPHFASTVPKHWPWRRSTAGGRQRPRATSLPCAEMGFMRKVIITSQ